MDTLVYSFAIVMLGLAAVWVFAINTSIEALRVADPALYRAAVCDLAGRRRSSGAPEPDRPRSWTRLWPMQRWMRRQWRHQDVHKHRTVRRWMYVHHGAFSALIAVFGFGVALLVLN